MNNDSGGINLLEAFEALSTIAENNAEIHWKPGEAAAKVKSIFSVIFEHLESTCGEGKKEDAKEVERVKSIMLLVGEAARKIDRLYHSVHITETKEYRQLQNFYKRRISKTIDEAILSKWILSISMNVQKNEMRLDTKHVFVDLDSVKNDTDYELFFIKKENGTRFFSPRLIRNITLICDFGLKLSEKTDRDPLVDLPFWIDRWAYSVANTVLKEAQPVIQHFYPAVVHQKDHIFCSLVYKALLALRLAANANLLEKELKGNLRYLKDFQSYLREALETRTYQQMAAFPNQTYSESESAGEKIIEALLKAIFEGEFRNERLSDYFISLIEESKKRISQEHNCKEKSVWSRLVYDFTSLQKFLKNHSNGPLNKILKIIEEGDYNCFDPYLQSRFQQKCFNIGETMVHILPSPTSQESIDKAVITPEFLSYLRKKQEEVLLVNFQDRTLWREHARSKALEHLGNVVSLSKECEFYTQEPPFSENNQIIEFKKQLAHQIFEEGTGFYFPEKSRRHITKEWFEEVFSSINKQFFSNKNVLSKDARLDFIEIFYACLILKIVESLKPSHLFLICKDGVDVSPAAAVTLHLMEKFKNGSEVDFNRLAEDLYGPALLSRERLLQEPRAKRMLSSIKTIENGF